MQIYERINSIIKSKGLKKKDFLERFTALEPRLKSTGEIPSIPTIYNYLNGTKNKARAKTQTKKAKPW